MSDYLPLIKKLYQVNLFGGVKLGLENCQRLDLACGSPSQQFSCIHIAGSNGKGSVTTKIAKTLELHGLRVGLYTSPHIACFRERIRINGVMIPEERVTFYLKKLFDAAQNENIHPTFFEFTTLLAFNYFAEEKVDFAVLETGLGGRLDATNIVVPQLSVITSISLDHTEILGPNLESITKEKAGIIKPGVPVLIGPHVPYQIVQEVADRQNAALHHVKQTFSFFEQENYAIAAKAVELLGYAPNEGLDALPACRMEKVIYQNKTVLLDVAHNPDGLQRLFESVLKQYPGRKFRMIFGLSKTKDIHGCLEILKANGSYFHLVEAPNGRGANAQELEKLIDLPERCRVHTVIADAVREAVAHEEMVIVCGSFFIMAEARKALGIQEVQDPIDMNEKR